MVGESPTSSLPLPTGWSAREPDERDVAGLTQLRAAHTRAVLGHGTADVRGVLNVVVGSASWTRRQLVVLDDESAPRLWVSVHDRAAGRAVVDLVADPALPASVADELVPAVWDWAREATRSVMSLRRLSTTQLDSEAYADDPRQRRWLSEAGFTEMRSWLQMSRPVSADEAAPDAFPPPRAGTVVKRVRQHSNGLPLAQDVQAVHRVLEESFVDHFNSYRESFPEFAERLQGIPGHRWDHWWLAFVDLDGELVPGGALVSGTLAPGASGAPGSYVEYIGVHRRARGRGVAKALLHTVITDAARRGCDRVGLDVDADSPSNAHQIYASMGWEVTHVTQSWHQDLSFSPPSQ